MSNLWEQIGDDINGVNDYDRSGEAVALNGDGSIVAIGATQYDNNTDMNIGYVRVFKQIIDDSVVWNQLGDDIIGETAYDFSGFDVSLNTQGNIIAISSIQNDDNKGHVRIYQSELDDSGNTVWNQLGEDIDGDSSGDKAGYSISLNSDGDIIAIGYPEDDNNGSNSGLVRVYKSGLDDSGNTVWEQLGQDILGNEGDKCGLSVALNSNGNIVVIGSPENDKFGENAGKTRVYQSELDDSGDIIWNQVGGDIGGEDVNNRSGETVTINGDGTIIAIASRYNNDGGYGSGHTRVYQSGLDDSGDIVWEQLGIDIDGDNSSNVYGPFSLSLNSEGNILAIGMPGNEILTGLTRVYQYLKDDSNDYSWEQLGQDFEGGDIYEYSGTSIALNSFGDRLAIGTSWAGSESGYVRIYEIELPESEIQGSGFGDPHIIPIISNQKYDLPHKNKTYLLFNNNQRDQLQVKALINKPNEFNFIKSDKKNMFYFKYIKFEYKDINFIVDMDTLKLKEYTNLDDLNKCKLPTSDIQEINNCFVTMIKNKQFNLNNKKIRSATSLNIVIEFNTSKGRISFTLLSDPLGMPILRSNIIMNVNKLDDEYEGALYKKQIKEVEF